MTIEELDPVVLTRNLPEYELTTGDVGTAVFCYPDGETYEVEFVTAEGRTIALLKPDASDLRPMEDSEILHVRSVGSQEPRPTSPDIAGPRSAVRAAPDFGVAARGGRCKPLTV